MVAWYWQARRTIEVPMHTLFAFLAGAGLSAAAVLATVRAHERRSAYTILLRALRAGVHQRQTD
jgi:hypothetical protein